ncbi:hypothetical protein PILCRDRAFT_820607 [Piloderma croceum F 1598]|uniref:Uncharacterized protein n=1 Tax=Piloderma croceum (strain F 1598) TaxID=765440 RepID=A0A0C3FRA1_PILCF|nr:hypothetical protein PILCRDRAFT_820607 [Piloderma croceum F 1598]
MSSCLQCTPFLTKLSLKRQGAVCITTKTLSRLTNRPGRALCLVPKPQDLQFCLYPALNESAFADIIDPVTVETEMGWYTRPGCTTGEGCYMVFRT